MLLTSDSSNRLSTVVSAGAFHSTWATNPPSTSVIVYEATPPVPPGPWQLTHASSKFLAPRFSKRLTQSRAALSWRAGSISQ